MSSLSKLFHFGKGKKKKGRGDRQADANTSSASTSGNTGDQSAQTETISPGMEMIGLFVLSTDEAPKTVDVVAVHGLQGDAFKTWEYGDGTLWLRDLLPEDIPSARIMTFGYDSTVAFSKSVARIEDKALDLLNRLGALRDEDTERRSVVFICHSLGGIVVKKALILAHERSSDPVFKDILINTKAIAFLGVPHKGSDSAWWANFAANALKGASIGFNTNNALVADLRKDSSALSTISKQFIDRGRDLSIYTFYERLRLKGVLVVDEQSARLNLPNEKLFPVDADHRTICKISSREDQVYKVVGVWIAKLIKANIERTVPIEIDAMTFSKSLVDLLKAKSSLCLNAINLSPPIPIVESPEYVKWTSGETKEILWYRGIPGCGKSTMVSQVLKGVFEDLAFTDAAAFFDFDVARTMYRTANIPAAVISFIAAQLLERNPNLLLAMSGDEQKTITTALLCTHRIFSYTPSSDSESRRVIPGLVSALRMIQESTLWSCLCRIIDRGLETMSRIYLIFDGDDNALPEDRFRFLRNIRRLWECSESTQRGCVKVLIASRDYPKAREVLDGLPYLDNEKEQQDCINSLRLGAANARMSLIKDGEKNTGEWILSDSQYCGWRNEPASALLWLQGNPGTGKSTLMKQIQNRLSNEDGLSKAVVASFYYSAREGEAETSHTHMLQALLYQILLQETQETYPFFRSVFRVKREQMQPWRFEEMQRIFVSLSSSHSGSLRLYLLLDALDESDKDGIAEVISLLKEVTTSKAKLKVLVASRPGPIISSRLAGSAYYHLILEDENKKDIEEMITSSIGFLQNSDRTTFEWMSSYILSRARGVFLWVSLIVSDIKRLALDDGWSDAELKAEVKALPISLVPYYKRITSLLALQESARVGEGIRMLRWVVYSERILTVDEFRDAVATSHLNTLIPFLISTSSLYDHRLKRLEHVSKRLMRNCGELVEVKHPIGRVVEPSDVDRGDVVQLFHETVREFLKDPTRAAAPFDMKEILGHAEIAVVCARYIRMALILDQRDHEESRSSSPTDNPSPWKYETHRIFAQHLSDRPLLPYALKFLPRHMSFLEDGEQAKTSCLECFSNFDSDHGLLFLSSWLQTSFHPPPSKVTVDAVEAAQFRVSSLVAAADQGLATAVKSLIELQTTLDAVEETTNHSALQIASKCGHLDVVDILIESEASLNFHGGHFGTALQAAAYSGCDSIVKTLLARGADPNSESGYLLTPYYSACCMGHYGSAELLLKAGADPVPPRDLFRNIWDSNELKNLVRNFEDFIYIKFCLSLLLDAATIQFVHMGQMSSAEEMGQRAQETREKELGAEHPETLISVTSLASVLESQGKYKAAERMSRRVLEGREKVLGAEHPDTLTSVYNLASLFHVQTRYMEASDLCLRASEGFLDTLGPDDPKTQRCSQLYSLIMESWTERSNTLA